MPFRFNLSFTDAEKELYDFLRSMENPTRYLKQCIHDYKKYGSRPCTLESFPSDTDVPFQVQPDAGEVGKIYDRVFGDILDDGEFVYIAETQRPGDGAKTAVQGRLNILKGITNYESDLYRAVMNRFQAEHRRLAQYV